MKKVYFLIFFIMHLHAQQYDERVVGTLVSVRDRQTWKRLKKPTDVKENEVVAVYHTAYNDWVYAEVRLLPGENFTGLANCVTDGLFYNNFAVNFKINVKKLLAEGEVADSKWNENILKCSIVN